ncbi:MAG: ParA family protein [Rubrivivax sp.]|nr:ParA family protein [Rubrivivax sp.]
MPRTESTHGFFGEHAVPVIAVVNRKGGSGKSTLATHLAAWLALRGDKVMLGDVDRQRSTVPWLKLRAERQLAGEPLHGWVADPRNVLRPPAGVRHVVLDTPGGLQGFDLGRVLTYSDIVLLPLADSLFDRESAAACLAEMRAHPRVASGRVQVGVVGMRLDAEADHALHAWAAGHDVVMVGALSDSRIYVSVAERGLTVFDLPREAVERELGEWESLLEWLTLAAQSVPQPASARARARPPAAPAASAPAAATEAAMDRRPAAGLSVRQGLSAASGVRLPISLIGSEPSRAGASAFMRRWLGWVLPQALSARSTGARLSST